MSRSEWKERVRAWRASGLTGREFAEQLGVKEATLRHWGWQLSRDRRASQSAFVEVVVPHPGDAIEIVVRDGIRVRVPNDFDEATLRRVVSVLEAR